MAAEARRAHIRRIQLAPFERDIVRGETPDERATEQGIVRDLLFARARLRAERSASHPDPARITQLTQQVEDLLVRRADQQAQLFARLPDLQRWRGAPASPSAPGTLALAKVSAAIDALVADGRTLAVEYVVDDDEVLVLSLAHGDTGPDVASAIVASSRRVLADAITHAMEPAALQDAAEWRKRAAPLTAALVTPIASRLAERDRCIIVPDDLLWKVPFEALPEGGRVLAARMRLTYATSLATLDAQRALPAAAGAPGTVIAGIIAAPTIPAAVQTQLALTHQGWKPPDAVRAMASARAIAEVYASAAAHAPTTPSSTPPATATVPAPPSLTGADATETAVRTVVETTDVVHLGAPLEMSGPTPLFSSVLLGGSGDAAQNDGRWEAREWFTANSRARVMVIPDATTFGAAGAGGAMDVVAWAAAAAGVSSLVLGRWPADGFTPDALVVAFHAQLAKGVPASEALAAAMAALREKSGDAPANWAGLRLIGGNE
jgi:CHAT domain-containing protein